MEGEKKFFTRVFPARQGNRRGRAARVGITIPRDTTTACAIFLHGLKSQGQRCDAGRDIESGITFDAERL